MCVYVCDNLIKKGRESRKKGGRCSTSVFKEGLGGIGSVDDVDEGTEQHGHVWSHLFTCREKPL